MAKLIDPDDLTYSVNSATNILRFDTALKTIELVEGGAFTFLDGVTGQCLFSKIKEVIKADATLIKYDLPVREMIHDESMELIAGWTFKNANTLKSVRDCGVAYVNTAGVTTAEYACFVTLGAVSAGTSTAEMYLAQSSATDATTSTFTHLVTGSTFGVNELVQIYSDTNGDGAPDFDLRSYAKIFLRRAGYTFDESSNLDIGYPTLTYKKYNFPITHAVDAGVTVDDVTLSGYTGLAITWYAAAQDTTLDGTTHFNVHVDVAANGKTHDEVYSWVQYQLRQSADIDAGAGDRTGKVAAALVFMDGATLKTKLQSVGGVRISGISAASYNNVQMVADTGTYYAYPYTAAITFSFDTYLQQDGAESKFWFFDAATYPGSGATLLTDASGNPMTGDLTGNLATKAFSYKPAGAWADKAWVGVALGKDNAKIAVASGTIVQSTTNGGSFVAGLERWYTNPA